MQNRTNNKCVWYVCVCVYEWVFSNAKARKCWIIDIHVFVPFQTFYEKRGQKRLWTTIIEILWIFFLQYDARPNQILKCLFLMPMNLCNKCHVLPFIACPSHVFFSLFQFQWDFRRKTWTHKLTYAKKKKWEYHKNEITVEPNEIHQMCISNMKLASHERPSLDSMSNQWFIYNR